jgi:hypothetical protein
LPAGGKRHARQINGRLFRGLFSAALSSRFAGACHYRMSAGSAAFDSVFARASATISAMTQAVPVLPICAPP